QLLVPVGGTDVGVGGILVYGDGVHGAVQEDHVGGGILVDQIATAQIITSQEQVVGIALIDLVTDQIAVLIQIQGVGVLGQRIGAVIGDLVQAVSQLTGQGIVVLGALGDDITVVGVLGEVHIHHGLHT